MIVWTVPDAPRKEPLKSVPVDNPHKDEVMCVTGAPKEGLYASGSKDGWIRLGKLGR